MLNADKYVGSGPTVVYVSIGAARRCATHTDYGVGARKQTAVRAQKPRCRAALGLLTFVHHYGGLGAARNKRERPLLEPLGA